MPKPLQHFIAALLLTACGSIELAEAEFRPSENGRSFEYKVTTASYFHRDDPESERARIEAIEKFLANGQMCRNGYEVTNRQVFTPTDGGLLGTRTGDASPNADIFYFGRCL